MKMNPDQKKLKAQFKAQERKKLEDSIPMSVDQLKEFLSFLNRPEASSCDHTLKEAAQWLEDNKLDQNKVIPWLNDNGGFCDCEVISNVYDAVGDIVEWHLDEE